MCGWDAVATTRQRELIAVGIVLFTTIAIGGALVASTPDAQASMQMDGLSIADTNETVSGNVTDVTMQADLSYQHDVLSGRNY